MLDSECMHAMQAQARPVISLCCSALRGMPKLSSDNRGLVDVMHPEREGDEVLVTLPGLYQITVKIEHSPVFELPFETRKQLSDLSKFLKAKSIRCSKCEGMMNAEHFSRKNVDSIEERLLAIFSGELRVQPFKRMVTCAWCSDGEKTWVQKLSEHIQRQDYTMEMTLSFQIFRQDLQLASVDTTWHLGENASDAKQRLAMFAMRELAQIERQAARGSGRAPRAAAPNSHVSDESMTSESD